MFVIKVNKGDKRLLPLFVNFPADNHNSVHGTISFHGLLVLYTLNFCTINHSVSAKLYYLFVQWSRNMKYIGGGGQSIGPYRKGTKCHVGTLIEQKI